MTYKELQKCLKDGRKLRSFPLVDNRTEMILLGSIQRAELISSIENHIGADRRIEVATKRLREEEKRVKEKIHDSMVKEMEQNKKKNEETTLGIPTLEQLKE